jgi:hypothetical protein
MDLTLKRSVEDYVKQFGSVELRRNLICDYFNCEINGIPTLIYPVYSLIDQDVVADIKLTVDRNKNSHRIIRLDVTTTENDIALFQPVIIADLVSKK